MSLLLSSISRRTCFFAPVRVRGRFAGGRRLSVKVRRPVVHEPPPLEQVRSVGFDVRLGLRRVIDSPAVAFNVRRVNLPLAHGPSLTPRWTGSDRSATRLPMPGASSREKAATQFPPVSLACITTRMLSVPYPGHQPILANRILAVRVPDRRDVARRGAGERARITSAAADARAPAHDRRRGDNDPASPFSARLFRGSLSTTAASGRARRSPCAIAAAAGSRSSCDGSASTDGAERCGSVAATSPAALQAGRCAGSADGQQLAKRSDISGNDSPPAVARQGSAQADLAMAPFAGGSGTHALFPEVLGILQRCVGRVTVGAPKLPWADHSQPYES